MWNNNNNKSVNDNEQVIYHFKSTMYSSKYSKIIQWISNNANFNYVYNLVTSFEVKLRVNLLKLSCNINAQKGQKPTLTHGKQDTRKCCILQRMHYGGMLLLPTWMKNYINIIHITTSVLLRKKTFNLIVYDNKKISTFIAASKYYTFMMMYTHNVIYNV